MLALGDRMAQGLGVSVLPREHLPCLRSRCSVAQPYRLWPHWFCRPVGTADCPASGIRDLRVLLPLSACVGALLLLLEILLPGRFSRPMS